MVKMGFCRSKMSYNRVIWGSYWGHIEVILGLKLKNKTVLYLSLFASL